ncbi:MAG: 50S ribosomal protein L10 [Patescibacteria group bacterium]|nr:50S ribosomal protein L10 [Patescibacteria group bacterium]MDD5121579.1 50S ribosomal protein L10 [Patescibacteria group bacterium]MDD5222120.1 50S ribosomal protein L10 [Patescibacteria group bacterium]MDD5396257.1 50S ribosomal protein L10 [Patescibacteria group bacterium]
MALTRTKKESLFTNIKDLVAKMKSLVLIDYYGLKVKEVNQLRQELRKNNCQYVVAKKTLLKKAFKEQGLEDDSVDKLQGGIGMALGLEDEVAPARVITAFKKDHDKMNIHGGIFNKAFITLEQVKQISILPSKEQLLAQVVYTIKAPLQNMVGAMHGNLRKLVYALQAVTDKKKN